MNKRNIILPFSTTFIDYPDNESLAILIFIMGCERNCKDCHNPEFKDPLYTDNKIKSLTADECMDFVLTASVKHQTNKVVLTGGDPLYNMNVEFTKSLLGLLKEKGFETILYTAYNIEHVKGLNLSGFNFVKTGEYNIEQKQTGYKTDEEFVLASKNQSIYDKNYKLLTKNGILKFK